MKYRWDKKYLCWGLTAFAVIAGSMLFFFALLRFDQLSNAFRTLLGILKPILYGLAISYLLEPVMTFFERPIFRFLQKKIPKTERNKLHKISRCISIGVTMVLALLLLTALISMIIPQLVASIVGFANNLSGYLNNFNSWVNRHLSNDPDLNVAANKVFQYITQNYEKWWDTLQPGINNLLSGLTVGVFGIINALKNILVGFIVSIYVLFSKDLFAAQAKKVLYAVLEPSHANSFLSAARHTHKVFGGFIVGKLLDSLIIGILCFIGMSIFKMPFPLLISVIVGVTNIIPFFGPFIGAIPSAVIILLVEPVTCIYFVLFILALQQFDGNILGPKILGESTGLSCFWVIFSILVAGGLFGFIGMVIGVPLFAVIYGAARMLIEWALQKKGMPTDTRTYESMEYFDTNEKKVINKTE